MVRTMVLTQTSYNSILSKTRAATWDPGYTTDSSRHGERTLDMITGVEVHWTGTPGSIADPSRYIYWINRFRNYHVHTQGWWDLFYHLELVSDGTIVEGRDITVPSQRNLMPWLTLLVLVGPDDQLTPEQISAIRAGILRVWKAVSPSLSPDALRTHRERAKTACPGDVVQSIVDDLRSNTVANTNDEKWMLEDLQHLAGWKAAETKRFIRGRGDAVASRSVVGVVANRVDEASRARDAALEQRVTELEKQVASYSNLKADILREISTRLTP